ncbi:orotate phosphoribosyltransferase [Thermoplasmatales archaeon AK]|nr:orotate phosphoribosyltransferase [Thermoplasmatales archaeon AK]
MDTKDIGELLIKHGAVKFGDFVLTSGKKSNYYVDIKDAATDPEVLKRIASALVPRIASSFIAGVELGAVPILVATALTANLRYIIIRKERKHGTGKLNIGDIPAGQEVEIIEDVVTTGNSVLKAARFLRDNGAIVRRVHCIVDREEGGKDLLHSEGIELVPLVRITEMMSR